MLDLHPEVAAALRDKRPIVALESTLIAHGLPPLRRKEAAAELEAAVREEGAIPATIAILDGRAKIGLSTSELARVAGGALHKASLRDLAIAFGMGGDWATTVATTMALAARAGIKVFATGGIGGVHREVIDTFDESADLLALAKYPVTVVSAGAKLVLDLPRTFERLETLGVPVIGYRCQEFPAFYHAKSGIALRAVAHDEGSIARVMHARFDLLNEGGILVVQPPPAHLAQEPERVAILIDQALQRARTENIRGAAITPFLLSALDESSGGAVVETNLALVLSNARLAARIAVAAQQR